MAAQIIDRSSFSTGAKEQNGNAILKLQVVFYSLMTIAYFMAFKVYHGLVCYGFLYCTLMYYGLLYDTMVSGGLSNFRGVPRLVQGMLYDSGLPCLYMQASARS